MCFIVKIKFFCLESCDFIFQVNLSMNFWIQQNSACKVDSFLKKVQETVQPVYFSFVFS